MLKRIGNFLIQIRVFDCVFLCGTIILAVMLTFGFDFIKSCVVYPEKEFQVLENEAQRIIDEKTLSTEFKHSVQYDDNLESKSVKYILYGGDNSINVSITVNNYGESNQKISINRNVNNEAVNYLGVIAALILAVFMFSICSGFIIYLVVVLLGVLCFKVDGLLLKAKEQKNRR